VLVDKLTGVVLVKDVESVVKEGLVQRPRRAGPGHPAAGQRRAQRQASKYLGQPLTKGGRVRSWTRIALYCRQRGQPFVDVSILPAGRDRRRTADPGAAGQGRLRPRDGQQNFDSERIAGQMRNKAGEQLDVQQDHRGPGLAQRNPFRQVDLVYVKGGEFGQANLLLKQTDQYPLRVYAGYDDSGTRQTQNERVSSAADWGTSSAATACSAISSPPAPTSRPSGPIRSASPSRCPGATC